MPLTRRRFIAQTAAATLFGAPAVLRARHASSDSRDKSPVRKVDLANPRQFADFKEPLEADYPSVKVSLVEVDGDTTLRTDHGGMKVFWIYQGQGEVYLPKGYRTQERWGRTASSCLPPRQDRSGTGRDA